MYRIVYGIFYLLSLLPWRVLYLISDLVYVLLYYVFRYRREVVMNNLSIAFPEKSAKEKTGISKEFYRNFTDNFIELIKLITISEKEFRKRITTNIELENLIPPSTQHVAMVSAHFFSWEFANLAISLESRFPFLGVYMPLGNKVFDRLMYDMRKKFGAILIPATEFRRYFVRYSKQEYVLGLISDQSPGDPNSAYWTPFFGKMTPFVKGPERSAKSGRAVVAYMHFYPVRRGYYKIEYRLVTTDPNNYPEGALTRELVRITEECIREHPANYLWSHRRWKWEFDEQKHGHLVI